jgi:hypothetical protein
MAGTVVSKEVSYNIWLFEFTEEEYKKKKKKKKKR